MGDWIRAAKGSKAHENTAADVTRGQLAPADVIVTVTRITGQIKSIPEVAGIDLEGRRQVLKAVLCNCMVGFWEIAPPESSKRYLDGQNDKTQKGEQNNINTNKRTIRR